MPPQTIGHPPAAELFEVGVQHLLTRIARHRHEEVAPHVPDQVLDPAASSGQRLALVVTLAGSPEPVGEQVVGLELGEDAGALARTTAQDAGDGELRVVVEDALRHAAEEVERSVVPVTERLRRLRWEGLDEAGIAMWQVEGQEVRLPLGSPDLHDGLTEACPEPCRTGRPGRGPVDARGVRTSPAPTAGVPARNPSRSCSRP